MTNNLNKFQTSYTVKGTLYSCLVQHDFFFQFCIHNDNHLKQNKKKKNSGFQIEKENSN